MFRFNPRDRITARDALSHPYIRQFRRGRAEPTLTADIVIKLDDNVKYIIIVSPPIMIVLTSWLS